MSYKKIFNLLLLWLPFYMGSCTINEELEIKSDGSGALQYKTDLSKLIDVVKSFDSNGAMGTDSMIQKKLDSTILMKDLLDTAQNISPEKKALLREGKIHVKLNAEKSLFTIDMELPYKTPAQLQQLYTNLNSADNGLSGVMDGLTGKEDAPFIPPGEGDDKTNPFGSIASIYDITVKDGLFSRKVNKERWQKFKSANAESAEKMKGMGAMMGAMEYNISIKFPRAVKKTSNPKAEISTDGKNVLLKTDLIEVMEHPEMLELEIVY
jgi:hypothetical protein